MFKACKKILIPSKVGLLNKVRIQVVELEKVQHKLEKVRWLAKNLKDFLEKKCFKYAKHNR